MKPYANIWTGSVRAYINLCFLMLTIVLAASFKQYVRHSLSHSVSDKIQKQEAIHLSLKENISYRLHFNCCSNRQDGDDLKA
jgi:hypothetical protein